VQLTILGTGFASNATVNFNGDSLTPSSISDSQIMVTVPASSLTAALTASVAVVNPDTAPLEGTSNVVFFPITIPTASVSTLAPTALGVGSGPYSVAVGDFNGDGKLDLAVANEASETVTILLGDGTGNFTAASSPPTGNSPNSVAVGDFNGDGKLDLAVVNTNSNTVSILLGDGAGNFTTASSPATGNFPFSAAVGDFNGDGKLDLAVANVCGSDPSCTSHGTVTILLGDGTGSFTTASSPATGTIPVSVAVGDFSGDGRLDLAVVNASDNTVSVLLSLRRPKLVCPPRLLSATRTLAAIIPWL
jgi:uncharacterized protein (DUF2141 family)